MCDFESGAAPMWRTAFSAFKSAKFLYLGPLLFSYVPEFSLNGTWLDIVKVFTLIIIGNYLLSLAWWHSIKTKSAA